MGFHISTKLKRKEYEKLKKVCANAGCTPYGFAQMAIVEKLQVFDDRELSITTEEKRFWQELHVTKTTILSYVKNADGDMQCKKCGEPLIEHDLLDIIGFVEDIARDKQCKDCGKPLGDLSQHGFDTILWALYTGSYGSHLKNGVR